MYFISPLKYYCHWWWFELWTQYPGSVVPLAMFRTVPREKMTAVSIFSELTPKKTNRTWCSSWLILTFVFQSIYNNIILHVYVYYVQFYNYEIVFEFHWNFPAWDGKELQKWTTTKTNYNDIIFTLEIFQLGMAKNYKNEWLQNKLQWHVNFQLPLLQHLNRLFLNWIILLKCRQCLFHFCMHEISKTQPVL